MIFAMATTDEKAYFARIAEQNRSLTELPPVSLQESFDRLEQTAVLLGGLIDPQQPNSEGDLASHLSFLQRLRSLDPDYNASGS